MKTFLSGSPEFSCFASIDVAGHQLRAEDRDDKKSALRSKHIRSSVYAGVLNLPA